MVTTDLIKLSVSQRLRFSTFWMQFKKEVVTELPIIPEVRLAMCLYRVGRSYYLHTISELTGLGTSMVCEIVVDVLKNFGTPV